jgi:hypothetical protein
MIENSYDEEKKKESSYWSAAVGSFAIGFDIL